MPPVLIDLIEEPHLLIAVLLIGAIAGVTVERLLSEMRRQAWREKNGWHWDWKRRAIERGSWAPKPDPVTPTQPDAADQLRIVMGAHFTIQPLLNKNEARVFRELDRIAISCNPRWQVMAQVSLGEILRCKNADAYGCINSKRVRHAIEYHGAAHYQGSAAARDAVKKEALRRAGIGYHEVLAGHTTPSELRRLVEKLIDKPTVTQ